MIEEHLYCGEPCDTCAAMTVVRDGNRLRCLTCGSDEADPFTTPPDPADPFRPRPTIHPDDER